MGRKAKIAWTLAAVLLLAFLLLVPHRPFKDSVYSTVVLDRNGELLGARISSDGQWRFPPSDSLPEKYRKALICFEDRWFYWHPGVNPFSLVRAFIGNVRAGHVTSGGSTITMQVVRMSRGKERTIWQKLIESVEALRLEVSCSKKEILAMYAAHAPFGGNVVGLEAASWRYFGRPSDELSWGEAALLAVLPNSPSSMNPGRRRDDLLAKRNRLLDRMLKQEIIDSSAHSLAIGEPLPDAPHALPSYASQYVSSLAAAHPGERIRTTIDIHLQEQVEEVADMKSDELATQGIADLAAVVIDVKTGEVLAYVGNASPYRKRPGSQVDVASSPRSTGSILKPFLYCALLQEGSLLPHSLVRDTPVNLGGFTPENFDLTFNGAVSASEALSRSLNVPSVYMLRQYGVPKFHGLLKKAGLTTLVKPASHYGLSLILGGAEAKLAELTSAYASMARSYETPGDSSFVLNDKAALWYTFDALKEVNRPDEIDWRLIGSVKKIAWKTGTSYGFRDAWAVGVNPSYAVGVWAGNAEGQGISGLTGARAAGPAMFAIFNLLPSRQVDSPYVSGDWFAEPLWGDCITAEVCRESGFLKGPDCDEADTLMLPKKALRSQPCPYHKTIGGKSVFSLPPAMEYFYRQRHPDYKGVTGDSQVSTMEFIYPEPGSDVFIPRNLDGSLGSVVFNLAHRESDATVFWHMDGEYLGETRFIHQMSLSPSIGKHTITVVDSAGKTLSLTFTVSDSRLSQ